MVSCTKEFGNNMKKLAILSVLFIILSIAISSIYPQIMAQESTIDSSVSEFLTYESTADGIRIKYPADWNVCEDSQTLSQHGFVCPPILETLDSLIVTFHSPPKDASDILSELIEGLRTQDQSMERNLENTLGNSSSLSVWVNSSSNQPLINHVNEKIKELNLTAPNFKIIRSQPSPIGAGIPAYELSYTFDLPEIVVEDDGNVTYLLDDVKEKQAMEVWTIHDSKIYQFTYLADRSIYDMYEPIILDMIRSLEFI